MIEVVNEILPTDKPRYLMGIMFEMGGVSEEVAKEAMRLASHKLPIKTKFVKREVQGEGEVNEG